MPAAFHRSSAARPPRPRPRLPWWALALPVVSFAVLLALVAGSSRAGAAEVPQGLGPLLEILARIVRSGAG
ncbi:hypothetical protein Stsp01_00200 [Streptomyces sp. NBRC 13847]|uniref:hypothetical protein n=1 Tax=Streptomyces TaxID=1883 RepID=UPI0024A21DBE|nr:hypothetical protein [Streptomyces sp. NBRC 13847]GLW13277.1 hypothetical protein Stsp01_00200 [Streptomyces sp. NBRC 13847]